MRVRDCSACEEREPRGLFPDRVAGEHMVAQQPSYLARQGEIAMGERYPDIVRGDNRPVVRRLPPIGTHQPRDADGEHLGDLGGRPRRGMVDRRLLEAGGTRGWPFGASRPRCDRRGDNRQGSWAATRPSSCRACCDARQPPRCHACRRCRPNARAPPRQKRRARAPIVASSKRNSTRKAGRVPAPMMVCGLRAVRRLAKPAISFPNRRLVSSGMQFHRRRPISRRCAVVVVERLVAVAEPLERGVVVFEQVLEQRELLAMGVLRFIEDDERETSAQPVGERRVGLEGAPSKRGHVGVSIETALTIAAFSSASAMPQWCVGAVLTFAAPHCKTCRASGPLSSKPGSRSRPATHSVHGRRCLSWHGSSVPTTMRSAAAPRPRRRRRRSGGRSSRARADRARRDTG